MTDPLVSVCDECGAELRGPVAAILHYDTMGALSECERRLGRLDRDRRGRILAFDADLTRQRSRRHRKAAG